MKLKVCSSLALCVWALLTSPAGLRAAIPPAMTVQGQLAGVDSAGVVGGTNMPAATQEMDLRIYTNSPAALYGKTKVPVLLEKGRFVAEIGDAARLTNSTNSLSGATYSSFIDMLADATTTNAFYLGIRPTGRATDWFPLMRIQSVPFALVAGDVKQATRTFDVRNGTATLRTMIVQGETTLDGPVTFNASSTTVFNDQVTIAGNVNVTGGTTTLSGLTVEGSSSVSNAALKGVAVRGYTTVKGCLTNSGITTVNGNLSLDSLMHPQCNISGNLTVSGSISVFGWYLWSLNTSFMTVPAHSTTVFGNIFGSRMCITNKTQTIISDSMYTNFFYETAAGATPCGGWWKAPADCFVTASYVVGEDSTLSTQQPTISSIAIMDSPTSAANQLQLVSNCIAAPYAYSGATGSYGAHKGCVCLFMRKGKCLCWNTPTHNGLTVYGYGFMREISVLYFAK